MDKNNFNFELEDKEAPFDAVKKEISVVEVATNGYVTANIDTYDGKINYQTSIASIVSAFNDNLEENIQDKLGELENEICTYEIFLSVKGLDNYKYRILFLEYGSISYPTTVVLNNDIADYCIGKSKTKYLIYNEKDLKKMIDRIINSDYFIKIVQNLINEALRRESRERSK